MVLHSAMSPSLASIPSSVYTAKLLACPPSHPPPRLIPLSSASLGGASWQPCGSGLAAGRAQPYRGTDFGEPQPGCLTGGGDPGPSSAPLRPLRRLSPATCGGRPAAGRAGASVGAGGGRAPCCERKPCPGGGAGGRAEARPRLAAGRDGGTAAAGTARRRRYRSRSQSRSRSRGVPRPAVGLSAPGARRLRERRGEDAPGSAGGPLAEDGCGQRGRERRRGTGRGGKGGSGSCGRGPGAGSALPPPSGAPRPPSPSAPCPGGERPAAGPGPFVPSLPGGWERLRRVERGRGLPLGAGVGAAGWGAGERASGGGCGERPRQGGQRRAAPALVRQCLPARPAVMCRGQLPRAACPGGCSCCRDSSDRRGAAGEASLRGCSG